MNGSLPGPSSNLPSTSESQTIRKPAAPRAPDFVPVESNNWIIHARYVRKEFDICKLIIEEDLARTRGCNEYANYVLGLIYQREGKLREALECFQKCCFLNPQNLANVCEMGRCWFLLGQKYQAVEAFAKAEKLSKEPDWKIYHNLGVSFMSLRAIGKAREYLTKAVHLGKTQESYTSLAQLYLTENDINSALDVYHAALESFPSNWELALALGQLYMQVGDTSRAFNNFGLSLAINNSSTQSLLGIASMCQAAKEYDVALSKYKMAGQKMPESVALWNNMGLCFFGKEKYVAAISCLKRANYLDPMDFKTLYNLGMVHIHTKQFASAFHFLSSAIKLDNRHALSFMLLGIVLQKLTYHENAAKCFEQAIKLDVDSIIIRINYISHLYLMYKREEALEQLNAVQRLLQLSDSEEKVKFAEAVRQLTHALTQGLMKTEETSAAEESDVLEK